MAIMGWSYISLEYAIWNSTKNKQTKEKSSQFFINYFKQKIIIVEQTQQWKSSEKQWVCEKNCQAQQFLWIDVPSSEIIWKRKVRWLWWLSVNTRMLHLGCWFKWCLYNKIKLKNEIITFIFFSDGLHLHLFVSLGLNWHKIGILMVYWSILRVRWMCEIPSVTDMEKSLMSPIGWM